MSERLTIRLWEPVQGYQALLGAWKTIKGALIAGHRLILEVRPETRSSEQNARMWAMLGDISKQVVWHGKKLSPEDWKHVFSASLRKLSVVPNLDGTGFVALGLSTSRMTKTELSDLMELMAAFGAERGVTFHE